MANSDKNILITPAVGSSSSDPTIVFQGASSTLGPQTITLTAYPNNSGTLSFDGSAGQLFSITNDLTGTIFSVNDVSGIPSIEVNADGTVNLAEFSGNVAIGNITPTSKLHVVGDIAVDNINLNGNTISTTNANGNLILTPNGTGQVTVTTSLDVNGNVILGSDDTDTITVNGFFVTGTQLKTAKLSTNVFELSAYDVDGAAYVDLVTLTASNTPTLDLTSVGVGTINNMSIGATTRSTGAFTTLGANGAVTFTANTASTTTGTGTLVVTGGIGVSGAINAGGGINGTQLLLNGVKVLDDVTSGHEFYNASGTLGLRLAGTTTVAATVYGAWTLNAGATLEATYAADLAEYYEGDDLYDVGTVMVVDGNKEVTACTTENAHNVVGIISNTAAYIMNGACPGEKNLIALRGRAPVKVIGNVKKGDRLIASSVKGCAMANNDRNAWSFAIALEDGDSLVEAVIL